MHTNTYMALFAIERNGNKCEDAALNHNCTKLTIVGPVITLWPPPIAIMGGAKS